MSFGAPVLQVCIVVLYSSVSCVQWSVGQLLQRMNKLHEAEAMYRDTFETAVKVEGPEGRTVRVGCLLYAHACMREHICLLTQGACMCIAAWA